jgi:hypothetical protein
MPVLLTVIVSKTRWFLCKSPSTSSVEGNSTAQNIYTLTDKKGMSLRPFLTYVSSEAYIHLFGSFHCSVNCVLFLFPAHIKNNYCRLDWIHLVWLHFCGRLEERSWGFRALRGAIKVFQCLHDAELWSNDKLITWYSSLILINNYLFLVGLRILTRSYVLGENWNKVQSNVCHHGLFISLVSTILSYTYTLVFQQS